MCSTIQRTLEKSVSLMEQPAGLGKKSLTIFQSKTLVIGFGWRRAGAGGG